MLATVGPQFDPAVVFPPNDERRVLQVRFIVASQSLVAIARLIDVLEDTPGHIESSRYLMILSIGAANEAALAFEKADAVGGFRELDESTWTDQKVRLARLRVEADHTNQDSLRFHLIKDTRNRLGFHWEPNLIKGAINALAGQSIPAWVGEGSDPATVAIPLTTSLIDQALLANAGSETAMQKYAGEIAQFQGDCFHVAHAVFTLALKAAGI